MGTSIHGVDDDLSILLDHCYGLPLSSGPFRPDREDSHGLVAVRGEFHEWARGQDREDASASDPVLAR